eukprot:1322597-Amorphochlora_amoeboformis.AAC.2
MTGIVRKSMIIHAIPVFRCESRATGPQNPAAMNLFGRAKKAPKPKISERINELKEAQEMLDKQEKHLEKQMDAARKEALKKSRQKNKKGLHKATLFHQWYSSDS